MPSATVRISPKGHLMLSRLASESGKSMSEVLEKALEAFRRQRFLEQAAAAYETLARMGVERRPTGKNWNRWKARWVMDWSAGPASDAPEYPA